MSSPRSFLKWLNNLETMLCELLLAAFVLLLFAQIVARQVFQYSIAWSEELSTYMFVWFAYLGAVVAAKMSAHNRVTFHFQFMPRAVARSMQVLADLLWVAFNSYFVYLSYDFVFHRMNLFWKSQTLGVPMKYLYMILPVAFTLMSVRILYNVYLTVFKGVELIDPEAAEIEKLKREAAQAEA
ncbi:TRAP-type C4-dicarboxylate transport system, small permease component [Oryzisolibacter propanilivorax]|uniref:TRAP transporter small permease protein n=1 Tax=Oryzisolibacter propanilivorax TaxID=1527607 RepID=A0A1G9QF51_9BURK|nr:TRAP transporter small permease [Oryzisolibacter propanilivorax]SDM08925.1 TRAP-type C4-dicarboxylate transport system, small permease component [Oryzisolibacter propanilivorax]